MSISICKTVLGLGLAVAAIAAPVATATPAPLTPAQVSRLGSQTEAKGFLRINSYLTRAEPGPAEIAQLGAQTEAKGFLGIQHALDRRAAAETARLGALTEARGYLGIDRYLQQQAATTRVTAVERGFAWPDAGIGAAVTAGAFLLGAAAIVAVRRRQGLAQLHL